MSRPALMRPIGLAFLLAACTGVSGDDPDLYRSLTDGDVALATSTLQTTLESAADGATRGWHDEASGHRGSITPTRSYLSAAGHFCRDYREELEVGDQSGRFFHAACRDDEGGWVWL